MNKTFRIIIITLITLGIIILGATIAANIILKIKLENLINNDVSSNIITSYEEISVHSLNGSILIIKPSINISNKEDSVKHTFIEAESLKISGISYWDYIFKKQIHIGEIIVDSPTVAHYKDRLVRERDTLNQESQIDRSILVDRFLLNNAHLAIYEKEKDSTKFFSKNLSVKMDAIKIDKETFKNKIPLEYKKLTVKGDSIFLRANPYDNLILKDFSIENKNITLNQLSYLTKYSKAELSKIIAVERDHYDLSIKSIFLHDFDFGFKQDSVFFAKIDRLSIDTPYLDIFRDKLVADDASIKPLYSRSLRELPFHLTVDSVKINDGFLKYEERVQEENSGGSIQFKNLKADIANISNTYDKPKMTEIKINALFMDKTPLSVDWSFDVQDINDRFVFKAYVGAMEAEKMNQFTEPNLKVRLEGQTNKTYFTIDGNDDNSKTDLKINYSDFKVTVLQKDGKNKNKFLSSVVNIFVSKDSKKQEDKFKEGQGEATRDKTKSVFNQLWISVKSALQKSIM